MMNNNNLNNSSISPSSSSIGKKYAFKKQDQFTIIFFALILPVRQTASTSMASVASADSAFNPSNPLAGVYSPKTSHLSIVQPMLDQYQQQQQQPQSESKYKKQCIFGAKNGFWPRICFCPFLKKSKNAKISKSAIICLIRLKTTFYLWPFCASISISVKACTIEYILSTQNIKMPAILLRKTHTIVFRKKVLQKY